MKRLALSVILLLVALSGCMSTDPIQQPCPSVTTYLGNGTFQAKIYAYEVDPNYYSTTSDGWWEAYNVASCYTAAWTAVSGDVYHLGSSQVGQYCDEFGYYYIDRGGLFFDTSAIAGGIVTGASLNLYGYTDSSTTDFDLTLQTGGATYPHDPMQTTDYNKSYYSGNGGSKTTSGWNTASYNEITLSSSGMSWIDTVGATKFMVRSSRDIAGTIPAITVDERVTYYDGGCGNISRTPYLSVNYTCGDWLDDYTYRKMFGITGSTAGAQTNYQMRVNVYAAAGTDSGSSVYTNYTTQTDFDDIRFTNTSGNALDFRLESYTSNVSAVFWVECDSIAASPTVTSFLMYYGNPAATSGSNGDNTFTFFDDFLGTSLNTSKWAGDTAYASVSGGIVTFQNGTPAWRWIYSQTATGSATYAVRANANLDEDEVAVGSRNADNTHKAYAYRSGSTTYYLTRDGVTQSTNTTNFSIDAYKTIELDVRGGSGVYGFENDVARSPAYMTITPPNSTDMRADIAASATNGIKVDWILLRKYVYPEPTISSWGTQQGLPAPTGVSATDGTYTDKVIVTWSEPCGASGYYIYRGGTYVTSVAAGTTSYNDTGAAKGTVTAGTAHATTAYSEYITIWVTGSSANPGATQTYTLKSYAGTANGTASTGNTGYRGVGSLTYDWKYHNGTAWVYLPGAFGLSASAFNDTSAPKPLITPGSNSASDGSYTNGINLVLTGYAIVDGLTNSSLQRSYKCAVNAAGADTAETGTTTGYKQASSLSGQAWRSSGDADSGYSPLPSPPHSTPYLDTTAPPPTINAGSAGATDGVYNDKVALNVTGNSITTYGRYYLWEVSATGSDSQNSTHDRGYWGYGTPAYQWYRSNSTGDSDFSILSGATTTTWNDTTAPAGSITPGNAVASDGSSSYNITVSISGNSTTVGEERYYLLQTSATGATSQNSTHDSGYRNIGAVQLQLMRSATDSDGAYSNIGGATSSPYVDANVPTPTITPGDAVASEGLYTGYVYVYLNGTSFNDADGRYYLWAESAAGAVSVNSTSDRGYEGIGTPQYQWQSTSGDEDWGYSNITGANSATLNDTAAPAGIIGDSLAIASDGLYMDTVTLDLFGGSAMNGSRLYWQCVLNGAGAVEQVSDSDRGFRLVGDESFQWFISSGDSDANYSNITSSGLNSSAYNTTNGVYYPDGRFYLANIVAAGATDKNATADRGNFYSNVSGCGEPPTIISDSSSGITFSSALLSGNISDVGCSNVTLRGFQWGTSSGCYTEASYDIGDFGAGQFNYTASDLSPVTTYFWRAYGMNGNGTAYGGELNFTTLNVTLPLAPTNFTATRLGEATVNGTYSINLTWTMGINSTRTIIRVKTTGYPANLTDGDWVYNGTASYLELSGLSLDTVTYYYSAWGENPLGDSINHAETNTGGTGMAMLVFGILPLGFLGMFLWKRLALLAYASAATWALFGFFAFQVSTSPSPAQIQDIYMALFWVCVALVIGMVLLPLVMREKKEPEELYVDELDTDLEKTGQKKREQSKKQGSSKFAANGEM